MCFPMVINSKGKYLVKEDDILFMNSNQSSGFISSVLLRSCLEDKITRLSTPAGKMVSEPYIVMTMKCLE